MKKLTISVLVTGLLAGSLFASENNMMNGMSQEKCIEMHKSMHENMQKMEKTSKNDEINKETGSFFTEEDYDRYIYGAG